jgi:hypothetical protein
VAQAVHDTADQAAAPAARATGTARIRAARAGRTSGAGRTTGAAGRTAAGVVAGAAPGVVAVDRATSATATARGPTRRGVGVPGAGAGSHRPATADRAGADAAPRGGLAVPATRRPGAEGAAGDDRGGGDRSAGAGEVEHGDRRAGQYGSEGPRDFGTDTPARALERRLHGGRAHHDGADADGPDGGDQRERAQGDPGAGRRRCRHLVPAHGRVSVRACGPGVHHRSGDPRPERSTDVTPGGYGPW